MSKHQLSERVLCKKIALLEGRKQSLEQLASLQPGITDRIEELPSDTLAAARFMVDERWRRIDEHQRCASLKQKMLKQSEKLITLNFGERRYEVIAPPPGEARALSELDDSVVFYCRDRVQEFARFCRQTRGRCRP